MAAGHLFTPPSLEGTIMLPGLRGGAHWGGAVLTPQKDISFINATEVPWILGMTENGSESTVYPYIHNVMRIFTDPEDIQLLSLPGVL